MDSGVAHCPKIESLEQMAKLLQPSRWIATTRLLQFCCTTGAAADASELSDTSGILDMISAQRACFPSG